jgi:uncharacterized protein
MEKAAQECGVGVLTLEDVVKELLKPGRDPRDELPAPILRTDVLEMKDLKPGMVLSGTVRNVIDFGIFVDIGVHQDGLVHISQVAKHKVRHPSEVAQVGDVVKVKAAGGIRDWATCKAMIEAGAQRIGTSASVAIRNEFVACEGK